MHCGPIQLNWCIPVLDICNPLQGLLGFLNVKSEVMHDYHQRLISGLLLTFIPFGVNMYMSAYCAGNNSAQNNITSAHSIVQTYIATYMAIEHKTARFLMNFHHLTVWSGRELLTSDVVLFYREAPSIPF